MDALLELQFLETEAEELNLRASGISIMCNGNNSSVSMWCG